MSFSAKILYLRDVNTLKSHAKRVNNTLLRQCYNVPPYASAQCADCDPSEQCMTPGCSADVRVPCHHIANGIMFLVLPQSI